ncbi:MAG TPA: right-handed parallel beta-helix repeat-containing protein, partial [Pseudonocardia sp.]|uniref:right-handed parallel beta-helix repeat-containing protein n=1 Tax=Pseudonocardia sp. TaxID=60912 RepID=UPI002F42BDC0
MSQPPGSRARGAGPLGWLAVLVTVLALLLAGCGGKAAPPPPPPVQQSQEPAEPSPAPEQPEGLITSTAPDGRGVIRPMPAPTGCTKTVHDGDSAKQALASAAPGNTICVLGDLGNAKLSITQSGTAQAPIHLVGDGKTVVKGITVQANYVTVSGLNALKPHAPGISLHGNNITLENSSSISPHGDDGDGIRFWGNNIIIRHNTVQHTSNAGKKHADCMQTFATDEDSPASQHVLIEANRCEDISNTCLIMEGPNSEAGDGSGIGASSDVTYTDNYCQNRADEALQIDDVQNLTITNNEIAGTINHAFALQNKTTGAKVSGNKLNSEIRYEVGMDDESKAGYQGPP